MEKRKVRFVMMAEREYEVDLAHFQNMQGVEDCKTIEEAVKFEIEGIIQDPFMFIDNNDVKCTVKYEIL